MDLSPLLTQCVPAEVSVQTVQQLIAVESHGDPLALNINIPGKSPRKVHAANIAAAVGIIQDSLFHGWTVDIGLTQMNTRTIAKKGYSFVDMLDPCKNIRAGALVLKDNYQAAAISRGPGQDALKAALSAYNTGSFTGGILNGYVAHYYPGTADIVAASHGDPTRSDIGVTYQNVSPAALNNTAIAVSDWGKPP